MKNITQSTNNQAGTLTVSVEVSSSYDVMGEINNFPRTFTTTIDGFQKITGPSQLAKKASDSNLYFMLPTEVISNPSILDVIFNELVDTSSFPQENVSLDVPPTTFSNYEAVANNVLGTITFYVTANKFYDTENHNLKMLDQQFSITLDGFKAITPSTIKVKPGVIPSQVTYEDLEFVNFVTIPPKSLISFSNINDDLGTLTVIVNNCTFYDQEGAKVTRTFKESVTATALAPKSNKPLIIGLSVGLSLLVVIIVAAVVMRIFYKRTHEV